MSASPGANGKTWRLKSGDVYSRQAKAVKATRRPHASNSRDRFRVRAACGRARDRCESQLRAKRLPATGETLSSIFAVMSSAC